ncbi:MAG: filamentous hemagglutinin N-terminal domain-containing protein [Nitrospiraceae bacterium]|nr:filamentous hemagglutinin N-terminal domain-containing protein [Nitrospiraceae bacterium]
MLKKTEDRSQTSEEIIKTVTVFVIAIITAFAPAISHALPDGGQVVGGSAAISTPNAATMLINQATDKAIINWNGFSINVNELVKFMQPSSSAIALNRVIGADPSVILGQLTANGRIFLINPNGILFGSTAKIDTAGLLATTLNIKDDDFMAGRYLFTQDASKLPSYVVNKGEIKIADNGFVLLVAPAVSNEGLIIANLGKVVMGAGNKLTLDFFGDGLITYAVEGKVLDSITGPDGQPLTSAVSNTGTIKADGGHVLLTADASNQLLSSVINQTGIIEAKSLINKSGKIILSGGGEGVVANYGTLDVSAKEAGAKGGNVTITGEYIGHAGTILADGSDNASAGNIYLNSTKYTLLTSGSFISASGKGMNSNGGDIRILSDMNSGITVVRSGARLEAKGGDISGDGGFVEVSAANFSFNGNVDTSAKNGKTGTFLLDPTYLEIIDGVGPGDQDANLPTIDWTVGDTLNNTVSEQALEAIAANTNIYLYADDYITLNDLSDGELNLKTGSGNSFTMETANPAPAAGITFVDKNDTIVTGGGDITINSGSLVDIGNLDAGTTGTVNITANDGDVTLGAVTAGNEVYITSNSGAIIDGNNSANNIATPNLTLSAWTGIGTAADALETQVSNLNAYTNSGDINIANTGNLTIDDFSYISAWGYGVENEGGNITITNTGSIDMPGIDGSGVYATGDIALTASGANSDITASTQAAQSDTGSVTFSAGRDIYLGQGGSSGDIYTNNGDGSITLSAGRNITIDNGTWVQSGTGNISLTVNNGSVAIDNNASIMTDYGNIDIRAADGINQNGYIAINNYGGVIGNFTANADTDGNGAGTFTLGSSGSIDTNAAGSDSGTIEISGANMVIENGASINAGNSSVTLDITGTITDNGGGIDASNLSVTGISGIGSSGSPLNINVETLTASSTNADIYITENDDVAINTINAGTGNVALNAGGAITDNNGAVNNITASNATLSASLDIGSNADPVEVTVSNTVNATSTSGGVFVVNLYVPPASSPAPSLLPANVLSSTLTDNGFTNTGYERAANTDQQPSTNKFNYYQDLQLNTITDSHITEDLSKTDIETGMERRR